MERILLILLLVAGASVVQARLIDDEHDSTYLYDYEVVRYRIDIDYGLGDSLVIRLYARGWDAPPRIRVMSSSKKILTNREDNGADWRLDFDFTAHKSRDDTFFLDFTHKYGFQSGFLEISIELDGNSAADPDGDIRFDRYYYDYDRSADDDDNECSAGSGGSWPALSIGGAVAGAVWLRRRVVARRVA